MLGNIALPSVFWESGSGSWLAHAAFFCSGILVSGIAVLGSWLALSSERLSHRILVGGLLLCLISTCFLIGVQIAQRLVRLVRNPKQTVPAHKASINLTLRNNLSRIVDDLNHPVNDWGRTISVQSHRRSKREDVDRQDD